MDLKEQIRKDLKFNLKRNIKYFAKSKHYKMFDILIKILQLSCNTKTKNILVYKPISIEPNIDIVVKKLRKSFKFYLPFMLDVSFKIVKYSYPFKRANYGILQTISQNKIFNKIDVAIIPVIGVDKRLRRIGHGKGYYDRAFNELWYRPLIIFVSLSDCFIDKILTKDYDIKCDFYITPYKIYYNWRGDVRVLNDIRSSTLRRFYRIYNCKKNKRCKL